jgi:hypothetical protein
MTTKALQIQQALEDLIKEGESIYNNKWRRAAVEELARRGKGEKPTEPDQTSAQYQKWYTQALPVVRQLLPDRYVEFQEQYRQEKRKELSAVTYTISDYLTGITVTRGGEKVFDTFSIFVQKFEFQINILKSALTRIEAILTDIRSVLQAELFDDEISVARELLKKSHVRAAGTIAGVIVERHLSHIADNHRIAIRKSDPTIGDLNDALKSAGIYDVPDWRYIQRLGDIRNLCAHAKSREPTKEEVEDLITGADKVIKTIY